MIKTLLGINNALAAKGTVSLNTSDSSLGSVVVGLLNFFMPLISAVAVGAVIYSGVLYIISAGDPEKITKAKKSLFWSILGVFIIAFSYLIMLWINEFVKNSVATSLFSN